MTKSDVILRLQEVFDNVFVEDVKVTESLSASDVTEWDSLSHITLIVAIEKAFKVRFNVGELDSASNVGELAALILSKLNTL